MAPPLKIRTPAKSLFQKLEDGKLQRKLDDGRRLHLVPCGSEKLNEFDESLAVYLVQFRQLLPHRHQNGGNYLGHKHPAGILKKVLGKILQVHSGIMHTLNEAQSGGFIGRSQISEKFGVIVSGY